MLKRKLLFADMLLAAVYLIPLFGVIAFGWNTKQIFIVYSLESLIIGFYNIIKMVIVSFRKRAEVADVDGENAYMSGPFFIILFTVIYGLFCFISTGIFAAIAHFGPKAYDPISFFLRIPHYLTFDAQIVLYIFFAVHGLRMFEGFIYSGKYKTASLNDLLLQPFSRVILTQAIVVLGVMFLQFVSAKLFMFIFVAVRIGVEIHVSIRTYKRQGVVEMLPRENSV